jgi:Ca2+-binding RTX toxin-like protein
VWWTWTAPTTGNYTFDTLNSNFDTWLSVYTGSALNSLSLIDFNDDVIPGSDLTSQVSLNATAGETYQIAVDGWSSYTGQINLNIAPTPSGSAGAGNLPETANADSINGLPDTIPGNAANNTLKGGAGADILTGGTGGDTLILPFAEPSVSTSDPVINFAGSEKKNLPPQGGGAIDAPSLFSPPANSVLPSLEKGVSPAFTEAKGASAGNQALGITTDPFRVAADPYLGSISQPQSFGL